MAADQIEGWMDGAAAASGGNGEKKKEGERNLFTWGRADIRPLPPPTPGGGTEGEVRKKMEKEKRCFLFFLFVSLLPISEVFLGATVDAQERTWRNI